MLDGPYRRHSARVLVLDGAGRLLLFKIRVTRDSVDTCWLTPGGGIDDGESPSEAAARELWEETRLRVVPDALGPIVASTAGYADLGWAKGRFRDDFFCYRVDRHQVDTSGFAAHERSTFAGHHWWTIAELTTTSQRVYPFGLVPLVSGLLAGRSPAQPVTLPWHH